MQTVRSSCHARFIVASVVAKAFKSTHQCAEVFKASRRDKRGDNLAYLAVGGFLVALALVFFVELSQRQESLLLYILGGLNTVVVCIYSFEFGTSRGEQRSRDKLAQWVDEQ